MLLPPSLLWVAMAKLKILSAETSNGLRFNTAQTAGEHEHTHRKMISLVVTYVSLDTCALWERI